MPLTVASEIRDTPGWVEEMLPFFNESCAANKGVGDVNEENVNMFLHSPLFFSFCLPLSNRLYRGWLERVNSCLPRYCRPLARGLAAIGYPVSSGVCAKQSEISIAPACWWSVISNEFVTAHYL